MGNVSGRDIPGNIPGAFKEYWESGLQAQDSGFRVGGFLFFWSVWVSCKYKKGVPLQDYAGVSASPMDYSKRGPQRSHMAVARFVLWGGATKGIHCSCFWGSR